MESHGGVGVHGTIQNQIEHLKEVISRGESDGKAWLAIITELIAAFGATAAAVYAPPFLGRPVVPFLLHNLDFSAIAHRLAAYTNRAPFLHAAIEQGLLPGVFTDREVIPFEQLQQHDYYKEILVPLRWADGLQIVPRAPSATDAGLVFAFYRFGEDLPFDADAHRLAQTLLPHLADCGDHFRVQLQDTVSPALRALDGFSTPCIVVAASGKCIHANLAAQTLLKQDQGLSVRNGVLSAADARTNKQLFDVIQRAAEATADSAPIETLLFADGPAPLLAIVAPLPAEDSAVRFENHACAAIYLVRVEGVQQYAAEGRRAQLLFNLTGAETGILSLFLAGRSLNDIATERKTATITVRTQLKSIMHKTHSRHQLDLLRFRRLGP
jgi:DNA-binding CsgD family transcriptional regulator